MHAFLFIRTSKFWLFGVHLLIGDSKIFEEIKFSFRWDENDSIGRNTVQIIQYIIFVKEQKFRAVIF